MNHSEQTPGRINVVQQCQNLGPWNHKRGGKKDTSTDSSRKESLMYRNKFDSEPIPGISKVIMKCSRCSQWSLSKRLKTLTSDREECRSIRPSSKTRFITDQQRTL